MNAPRRQSGTLGLRAQHLVYGELTPTALCDELSTITTIDMAHVVMLADQELIGPRCAALLLERILRLRAEEFAPLQGLPAPRGGYLMYEDYLIRPLGTDTGGQLHVVRSRKAIKAPP